MADEISVRNIRKFDGTNFQGWKFQVKVLLISGGLLDVVDGTRVKPENHDTAEAKQWQKDNAKAMFIISSSMDYERLEPLLVSTTAKQMWDTLCTIHQQTTAANKLLLTQRFHEYKMESGDSIVQHIAKVQNMAAQLADLGEAVSEITIMAKILASLSVKYSTLQTAWDSVDPQRQTLDNLKQRLISEEIRLGLNDEGPSAFAATGHKGKKPFRQNSEKYGKKTNKSRKDIRCFRCHELGHFASQCQKSRSGQDERKQEKPLDCAFIVELPKSKNPNSAENKTLLEMDTSDVLLCDSGASRHITYRRDWLTEYREFKTRDTVALGDNERCEIVGEGTVLALRYVDGEWIDTRIEHVLHVPQMKKNLFSVGVCDRIGYSVKFKNGHVTIEKNNVVYASGVKQENGVYRMFFRVLKTDVNCEEVNVASLQIWHERLGHVHKRAMKDMFRNGLVTGASVNSNDDFFCDACQLGKSHRLPFKKSIENRPTKPGELIHTDLCGPMSVESLGGAKFFLTFKDDATSFRFVYFVKHKGDVYEKFKEFEKRIENKFKQSIKILRSDNGKEFLNRNMNEYLVSRGIQVEHTAPYTPEQNGKAERENRTIVECARTMIQAKDLPLFLWAEAVSTAVYIINRTVSAGGESTPYEKWIGKKPSVEHLRIFGSDAFVHIPKQFTKKFDARAEKMILVGYHGNSANYRVYNPNTKKVKVSRDVTFYEVIGKSAKFDYDDQDSTIHISTQQAQEEIAEGEVQQPMAVQQQETPSIAARNLRDREQLRRPARYEVDLAEYVTPSTYQEAVNGEDSEKWMKAIEEEIQAHEDNHTWSIIPRTPDLKTIDSKWVFKVKNTPGVEAERFKARLCARGFMQEHGIDFSETFAPVVRYDSLRLFLAAVAEKDLELFQFDVQTAFLYGDLEDSIFMEVPEGLNVEEERRKSGTVSVVCKLQKSLYGLKQAPRCWNQKFTKFLSKFNFKNSDADKCVFIGMHNSESVHLVLFVDDGLVAAKSVETLRYVTDCLESGFKITFGDATNFVGLQIERNRENKTVFIHQNAYIHRILEKFRMTVAKAVSVPADPNVILHPLEETDERSNDVPYREAVGSLVFLSSVSRPDISFSVNQVSKFLNNHSIEHWRAVKRIFAYLIGTIKHGIMYKSGGSNFELLGFSDADFAGDIETRRSTTGYVFCFAGAPVTWSAQRQKLVTCSTTEAEYVAAAAAAREAIWIRKLLENLECPCVDATVLYIDNQSAIRLVKNPEFHKRTKHIDIRFHFIREKVENCELTVKYISSENQLADMFTKALARDRLRKLCNMLNVQQTEML